MIRIRDSLIAALVVAASLWVTAPATAGGSDSLSSSFDEFCGSWMQKLEAREADNVKHVKWQKDGTGVQGQYVGYSSEHKCDLKAPKKKGDVPIGKISYRELLYQKQGPSTADAQASQPRVVEITEVTEIFRWEKGKWIY